MKKRPYFLVALGLSRITPDRLLVLGRNMVTAMTGNAHFATPSPKPADVTAACDALEAAIEAYALIGGHRALAARNDAFAALKSLLIELGAYVQSQSNGDASIIESAGCGVRRTSSPLGILPPPQNVLAFVASYPGAIDLRWGGVRGRIQYRITICLGDPTDVKSWQSFAYTSKNRFTATGLQSDMQYYFRIETIGAAGISPVSDVATAKAA